MMTRRAAQELLVTLIKYYVCGYSDEMLIQTILDAVNGKGEEQNDSP